MPSPSGDGASESARGLDKAKLNHHKETHVEHHDDHDNL